MRSPAGRGRTQAGRSHATVKRAGRKTNAAPGAPSLESRRLYPRWWEQKRRTGHLMRLNFGSFPGSLWIRRKQRQSGQKLKDRDDCNDGQTTGEIARTESTQQRDAHFSVAGSACAREQLAELGVRGRGALRVNPSKVDFTRVCPLEQWFHAGLDFNDDHPNKWKQSPARRSMERTCDRDCLRSRFQPGGANPASSSRSVRGASNLSRMNMQTLIEY